MAAGFQSKAVPHKMGPYTIKRTVDKSVHAVTFLAVHDQTQQRVLLHMPRGRLRENAEFLERFRKEGEAAMAVEHAGIARVVAIEDVGGETALVCEAVEGRKLSEILKGGRLPHEKVAPAIKQLLQAIDAAHQQRVIHRSIVPDSIVLTAKGRLMITGLGVPRLTARERKLSGTDEEPLNPYMSPEEVRGEALTPRTDYYALGAILYHMLTGKPPYEETVPARLKLAIGGKSEPPALRQRNNEVPAQIARVVMKLMAKEAKSRYFSLEPALRDLTGEAPAPIERAKPASPRIEAEVEEEDEILDAPPPRRLSTALMLGIAAGVAAVSVIGYFIYKTLAIPTVDTPPPASKETVEETPVKPVDSDTETVTTTDTTEVVERDPHQIKVDRLRKKFDDARSAFSRHRNAGQYDAAAREAGAIVKEIQDGDLAGDFPDEHREFKQLVQVANQMYNAVGKMRGVKNPEEARPDLEAIRPLIAALPAASVRAEWESTLAKHLDELASIPCERALQDLMQAWTSGAEQDAAWFKQRYDLLSKHPNNAFSQDAFKNGRQLYETWVKQLRQHMADDDVTNTPKLLAQIEKAFAGAPWASDLPALADEVAKFLDE